MTILTNSGEVKFIKLKGIANNQQHLTIKIIITQNAISVIYLHKVIWLMKWKWIKKLN